MTDATTATPPFPAMAEPDPSQPLGSRANPAMLDALDADFTANAHALYAELRERGPLVRARFRAFEGEGEPTEEERRQMAASPFVPEIWMTTTFDAANTALLDDDRFSVDPRTAMTPEQLQAMQAQMQAQGQAQDEDFLPLSRSLLTIDPPDHTRLRKLVQPYFTGRAMDALKPRIQEIADELLDEAEAAAAARGESAPDRLMDIVDAYAYPLPVTVISEMLGVPKADRDQIRDWTATLLGRRGRTVDEETRNGIRAFTQYLKDLADDRRVHPGDDLTTFLVRAEDEDGKLDESELLSMLFIVFVAGHITTVNLIGSATVALLTHPEQLAMVRQDPSLVRNAIEETLRYWGPAENTIPRIAREDFELAGCPVHKGDRVMSCLAAADRDPAKFADPDRWDVTRPDANRHIAFGKGIHVCLGAPLARAEGEIAVATLLRRYPELRLAVPADELQWKSNFLRGFREIPVRF